MRALGPNVLYKHSRFWHNIDCLCVYLVTCLYFPFLFTSCWRTTSSPLQIESVPVYFCRSAFHGAIAVPSVTRCHCCCCCRRGHRCAGGVRHLVNGNVAAARRVEWAQHSSNASCLSFPLRIGPIRLHAGCHIDSLSTSQEKSVLPRVRTDLASHSEPHPVHCRSIRYRWIFIDRHWSNICGK